MRNVGLPLLSRDRTRQWLVKALDTARGQRGLKFWAYVIMPEHAHNSVKRVLTRTDNACPRIGRCLV